MKKVKFYALCCRNIFALKRHQKTIPIEDLVIVINTLNDSFRKEAVAYCQEQGIEYYVTESNGGPSKGKNSVLDLFEQSDNDYMVLVDGDDFITPHGVWTYKELAQSEQCPDVVALEHQYAIRPDWGYTLEVQHFKNEDDHKFASRVDLGVTKQERLDPDKTYGMIDLAFYHNDWYWNEARNGRIIKKYEGNNHSIDLSNIHQRWAIHVNKYISEKENHLRLTFFSKKITADKYRFNLDFTVGEDTLFYLDLKKAHLDGKIVMRHLFDRYPTYIYDTRIGGVVLEQKDVGGAPGTQDYGWYLWLKKLTEEYDRYEQNGIMSTEKIPRLNIRTYVWEDPNWNPETDPEPYYDIKWPKDYKPDVCGLVKYPGKLKPYF